MVRSGFTLNNTVVKSPTSVAEVPTFWLAPLVLKRTSSLSGHAEAAGTRVQKLIVWPLARAVSGVSSQLLMVPVPAVLLKFAPI